jgi:hypothetical protein
MNASVDRQAAQIEDSIERAASKAAEGAVNNVLQRLGIDTKDPIQAQADFHKLRALRKLMEDDEFLADLAFMRRWRRGTEKVAETGISTFVKWFVLGVLGLFVLGTKDWWIQHIRG